VLDEYRTVSNVGMIQPIDTTICDSGMCEQYIEIDVGKAYTSSFMNITKIPIFNEFDNCKPYDNSEIKELNLYCVKNHINDLFLNKQYNLCYGKFLNMNTKEHEIIAYTQASFIQSVNYTKLVDDLFKNVFISDNVEIENTIKKLVANINDGFLEKSNNKKQLSYLYDTIEEAYHYQTKHGGIVNTLQVYEETEIEMDRNPVDWGIEDDDDEEPSARHIHTELTKKGHPLYILSLSDSKTLRDGFRYIK